MGTRWNIVGTYSKGDNMATVKKPSNNMIRGSWFGTATVMMSSLVNKKVVSLATAKEYIDAYHGIAGLYQDGADLNHLILGECPDRGLDSKTEVPLLQRFCKAIQEVKDEARKNGVPLQLGYTDTESELKPVWYVDVDSPETEVFEIKLTPYGRKIHDLTGPHGVVFDTQVIECY